MTTKNATNSARPQRRRVTFRFPDEMESDVRLAGTFNNWEPSAHRLRRPGGDGWYAITLLLPVGRYEYKFMVDGQWHCDPACPDVAPNEHGTLNSVIEVR